MSGETQLQVAQKTDDSLDLWFGRSSLIARGRRDVAALAPRSTADIVAALKASLECAGQQTEAEKEANLEEARQFAEEGDLDWQMVLGSLFFDKDEAESAKWYLKAAEQGYPVAQCYIAEMYFDGKGVPQDYATAHLWFLESARQGFEQARWHLVDMYYSGTGVPQDYREAVKWLRPAADEGDSDAQYHLGDAYLKGRGVPKDTTEALKWIFRAAQQGNLDATQVFEGLDTHECGSEDQVGFRKVAYAWASVRAADRSKADHGRRVEVLEEIAQKLAPGELILGRLLADQWADRQIGES